MWADVLTGRAWLMIDARAEVIPLDRVKVHEFLTPEFVKHTSAVVPLSITV